MASNAIHERDFRRTVLIVDDEPVNLRLLGNILDEEYDIAYAQTGEEALDVIRNQRDFLSLVLLDIYMPQGNGFMVLDEIRKDEILSKIPVIVLTADKSAEVECLRRSGLPQQALRQPGGYKGEDSKSHRALNRKEHHRSYRCGQAHRPYDKRVFFPVLQGV